MTGTQYIWILNGISLMLVSGALAGYLLQNVALNQIAIQSSQNGSLGAASNAVDGDRNPSLQNGSCTLTDEESDPWWRVDLQDVYSITAVMITNRDEYENNVNGSEIWISKSADANDTRGVRCAVISSIPRGRTLYFSCRATEGRYVTVFLPGNEKILSLCEVEVYFANYTHPLSNVALKGDATQSSTLSFAAAFKAIDGRRNSYYSNGFCSHTIEGETDPWWRVDLQQTFVIRSVKITNRGDCCAERLDGAEIRIGNSLTNNGNTNPRCATISHIRAGKTYTFQCDGGSIEGRYVNVIIPGQNKTLTLCEVEVYGTPAVYILKNMALYRYKAQSSYCSGEADNECGSGFDCDGCCTLQQPYPWWRVDLWYLYRVSAVTIISKQGCCAESLMGAQIMIGGSLEKNGNKNPRCAVVSPSNATSTYTFHCNEMKGRYVNVFLPRLDQALTVCEVEVYASWADTIIYPPPTNIPDTVNMLLSGRTVTVVGKRLCWSDALFYCRRYHWDLLSLHSQQEQSEVEQLLGRIPFPLTNYVWLGLRRSVMKNNWFWMSGESMNFTKGFAPYYYSNRCGAMASAQHFLWGDQPCEGLLNFICESGPAEEDPPRVYFYSTRSNP